MFVCIIESYKTSRYQSEDAGHLHLLNQASHCPDALALPLFGKISKGEDVQLSTY